MATLNKQTCPTCGQSTNEREIALFSGMIPPLLRVLQWCEQHNTNEFEYKNIKHLFGTDNNVHTRFHDWIHFGGILYKRDVDGKTKGHYGMNMERARSFFAGRLSIVTRVWKNPLTGEYRKDEDSYRILHQIPHVSAFLNENMDYIVRYQDAQSKLF